MLNIVLFTFFIKQRLSTDPRLVTVGHNHQHARDDILVCVSSQAKALFSNPNTNMLDNNNASTLGKTYSSRRDTD